MSHTGMEKEKKEEVNSPMDTDQPTSTQKPEQEDEDATDHFDEKPNAGGEEETPDTPKSMTAEPSDPLMGSEIHEDEHSTETITTATPATQLPSPSVVPPPMVPQTGATQETSQETASSKVASPTNKKQEPAASKQTSPTQVKQAETHESPHTSEATAASTKEMIMMDSLLNMSLGGAQTAHQIYQNQIQELKHKEKEFLDEIQDYEKKMEKASSDISKEFFKDCLKDSAAAYKSIHTSRVRVETEWAKQVSTPVIPTKVYTQPQPTEQKQDTANNPVKEIDKEKESMLLPKPLRQAIRNKMDKNKREASIAMAMDTASQEQLKMWVTCLKALAQQKPETSSEQAFQRMMLVRCSGHLFRGLPDKRLVAQHENLPFFTCKITRHLAALTAQCQVEVKKELTATQYTMFPVGSFHKNPYMLAVLTCAYLQATEPKEPVVSVAEFFGEPSGTYTDTYSFFRERTYAQYYTKEIAPACFLNPVLWKEMKTWTPLVHLGLMAMIILQNCVDAHPPLRDVRAALQECSKRMIPLKDVPRHLSSGERIDNEKIKRMDDQIHIWLPLILQECKKPGSVRIEEITKIPPTYTRRRK